MSAPDGGSAFPFSIQFKDGEDMTKFSNEGMGLRDYFAAKAMLGILSTETDPEPCEDQANPLPEQEKYCANLAEGAYRIADAMLKERAK